MHCVGENGSLGLRQVRFSFDAAGEKARRRTMATGISLAQEDCVNELPAHLVTQKKQLPNVGGEV